MNTNQEIIDALIAWARATLPEIAEDSTYDHYTQAKPRPFPDVVCEVEDDQVVAAGAVRQEFPAVFVQPMAVSHVQVWTCRLAFMVSYEADDPDDPESVVAAGETAAHTLRSFRERLASALDDDGTLGSRVPFVSPLRRFRFVPPFVKYDDGTRGREMSLQLLVGEPLEAEL